MGGQGRGYECTIINGDLWSDHDVQQFPAAKQGCHSWPGYYRVNNCGDRNILEMSGTVFFKIDTKGMIGFDRFALLFNTIVFICTLVYFLLSARDMEKVGINYSEYFSLIFFVLCGITLSSSFRSLLMLFLGIEIISIPLYILTGSDKRNLKSNEASLKYFLLGAFSTGTHADGNCTDLWCNRNI